jgi:hypothetical protein
MIDRLLARPWIALAIAMVVHAALFVAVQQDLATADLVSYANYAHELAQHPSSLFARQDSFPFVMRLGLTGSMALLYRVFGTSPFTTNALGLISGLAIMVIAYVAVSTPRAKLLAVLFAMVCTPLLIDARELTPDMPCAAAIAASILCLSRRDRPRGRWWLVGGVVAWFLAFQVKEIAVWCVPIWGYAVIRDLRDRGARWVVDTFAPAVGVSAALVGGYLAFCAVFWGDPLARFTGIQQATSAHDWSLVGRPAAQWIARLTWQPPVLLFEMFRVALVPVVLSPWLVRGRDRIWIAATATLILMYWFGSSTLKVYMPLPPFRRMLLPAMPGILVLSALVTDVALDRIRHAMLRRGLAVVFALYLLIPHVNTVRKRVFPVRLDSAAFGTLRAELANTTDRVVLICADGDMWCPALAGYYFGFELPANLSVVTAREFTAAPLPEAARVRLLVNLARSREHGEAMVRRAEALGLRAIMRLPRGRLYDAEDGARLHAALSRPS